MIFNLEGAVIFEKIKIIMSNALCFKRLDVVVITTAHLHSTKPELSFKTCSRRVGDLQL